MSEPTRVVFVQLWSVIGRPGTDYRDDIASPNEALAYARELIDKGCGEVTLRVQLTRESQWRTSA